MNPQFKEVGESFVQHYYNLCDNPQGKANLAQLYHNDALLTFEGDQKCGKTAIMEKIQGLPQTRREITRVDCQPTMTDNGVLVTVLGKVITPGEDKSLGFTNTFILKQDGPGFYICNEVFQLNLHNA